MYNASRTRSNDKNRENDITETFKTPIPVLPNFRICLGIKLAGHKGTLCNFMRNSWCFTQQLYLLHVTRVPISLWPVLVTLLLFVLLNYGHLCRCEVTVYLNTVPIMFHESAVMISISAWKSLALESIWSNTLSIFKLGSCVFIISKCFMYSVIRTLIRHDLQIYFLTFYGLVFTFLILFCLQEVHTSPYKNTLLPTLWKHFYIPPTEEPVALLLVRVAAVSDTVEGWLLATVEVVSEACSEVDGFALLMEALVVCESILVEVVGITVGSTKHKTCLCQFSISQKIKEQLYFNLN